jgi:23S rRNA (pseudouridine1915-N3)-methyltransferase
MQKIRVIVIGKVKNKSLLTEINDLSKRLTRFEIIELKEVKENNIPKLKEKEYDLFQKYLEDKSYENFLLWEFGETFTTKNFYSKLKKIDRNIQFFITGAYGPNEDLKSSIKNHISLSNMTFTHEQALYLLVEQLYRVYCFENNINYTK